MPLLVAYDEKQSLLVTIATGTALLDTDVAASNEAVHRLALDAGEARKIAVWVQVTEDPRNSPNAAQRKKIAQFVAEHAHFPMRFALVTPSPIVRAALTAILWITPSPAAHKQYVAATIDDAVRWASDQRGEPLPRLRALYDQLNNTARTAAR